MKRSVAVVDDEEDVADLLAAALTRRGYTTFAVCSAEACIELLARESVDVVVTDIMMPGMSGIGLCAAVRESHPAILVIIVTGHTELDMAIEAIRAGAYDYVSKPVTLDVLDVATARAFQHIELCNELQRLRTTLGHHGIDGIAGDSEALRGTLELVRRVATTDATVLVTGESGTGKELVARAVHDLSPRRAQPFVAINCAALPPALLESELFGHVHGAFTDASQGRPGLFELAGAGTIFLDELGEMPLEVQVKLLRVLQERTMRAVGSDRERPFAARVIASTNRDLQLEVEKKRFREDLYYRINVVAIDVPPLRDRGGDVLVLAQYFLRRIAARAGKSVHGMTPSAATMLMAYDWPGNVRELENCVERAIALCRHDQVTTHDLPDKLHEHGTRFVVPCVLPSELVTLEEMERRYVRQVVAAYGGNKSKAARALGIDRRSVYRRLGIKDQIPDGEARADTAT